jgi:Domain of unknown function (DUF4157)
MSARQHTRARGNEPATRTEAAARSVHLASRDGHSLLTGPRALPSSTSSSARVTPAKTGHHFGHIRVTPATARMQARAAIARPNDRHEREAEAVASAVTGARGPSAPANVARHRPSSEVATDLERAPAGGKPLPAELRSWLEPRFGYDFGNVRIHTDARSAEAAASIGARAFTRQQDIVFGPGAFAPQTEEGQWLIAHELTHVAQQGAARYDTYSGPVQPVSAMPAGTVQASFFGSIWSGIKAVGSAIGSAIEWVGNRIVDATTWAFTLLPELPRRLWHIGETLIRGLGGIISFLPQAIAAIAQGGMGGLVHFLWERAKAGGAWILTAVSRLFDLIGGPELAEFVMHAFSKTTLLTPDEITAGEEVLGTDAIRWDQVRVAEGGFLNAVFALNKGRAFTSFHTINIPSTGPHSRTHREIMVHEMTHVYQYERAGSVYLGQAIHAQATIGYGYGGAAGLRTAQATGKHYRDFNREQQAQIAQDFYAQGADPVALPDYAPFIAELKAGQL